MTVSSDNLYSESWTVFRDWLKDNLTDPVTGSLSSTRKWIYNVMPEIKDRNFAQYPFIVVGDSSIGDEAMSFGIGKQELTFSFPITIYVRKADNKYDANQLDTISDELRYKLKKNTDLEVLGLRNPIIEDSPKDEIVIASEKIISRTFGITFKNVLNRS